MHLKQDFWSIRGQITNLAPGRCCFNVSNVITMLIPVATGNTRQAFADLTPLKDSTVRYQFCFLTRASNIKKLPMDQNWRLMKSVLLFVYLYHNYWVNKQIIDVIISQPEVFKK